MKIKRVELKPDNWVDAIFIHGGHDEHNDYGDPEFDADKDMEPFYPTEGHALLANRFDCKGCPGITWSSSGVQIELNMIDGKKIPVIGWVKYTHYKNDVQGGAHAIIDLCTWEKIEPGLYVGKRGDLE